MISIKLQHKKIIIQKSFFLYILTKTEQSEKQIRKVILFIIVPKRIKYMGINLTKLNDLGIENYITLMK